MKKLGAALMILMLSVLYSPAQAIHGQQLPLISLPFIERIGTEWKYINDVAINPDATRLVLATDTGLWLLDQKLQLLAHPQDHSGEVYGVDWNADGTLLASGSEDATIRIWDINPNGLTLIKTLQDSGPIYDVRWSPNTASHELATLTVTFREQASDSIFIASDVRIWNTLTARIKRNLGNVDEAALRLAWNSDGTELASSSFIEGEGWKAFVWNVQTGDLMAESTPGLDRIRSVAWRPASNVVAFSDISGGITLFDVNLAQPINFFGHDLTSQLTLMDWSPDSSHLAIGTGLGDLIILDARTDNPIVDVDNGGYIYALDWSASKPVIAVVVGNNTIRLFDVSSLPSLTGIPTITPYPAFTATPALSTSERSDA